MKPLRTLVEQYKDVKIESIKIENALRNTERDIKTSLIESGNIDALDINWTRLSRYEDVDVRPSEIRRLANQ